MALARNGTAFATPGSQRMWNGPHGVLSRPSRGKNGDNAYGTGQRLGWTREGGQAPAQASQAAAGAAAGPAEALMGQTLKVRKLRELKRKAL